MNLILSQKIWKKILVINNYKLGCHVSLSKKNYQNNLPYLLGSLNEAISYNADSFMIYTGSPQSTRRIPIDNFEVEAFHNELETKNFSINNIIIHAPYIVNLANPDSDKREFGINFLSNELIRAKQIGIKIVVLHPGNFLSSDIDAGIRNCANSISMIYENTKSDVKIALETMAGKGTEIGFTFEQLIEIINIVNKKYRHNVGVCVDTCHIYDAGYDIKNQTNQVIEQIGNIIGYENILCLHINDSKFGLNSHKDRHANIGDGHIGYESLVKFIFNEHFINKVKILETPWIDNKAPYFDEINGLISKFIKNE